MSQTTRPFSWLFPGFCTFIWMLSGCASTSKNEPPKRTEILVYHVSGLMIPDRETLEKCKELRVKIKTESCIMNDDFARSNRYVDSVTKTEYGVSVLEVLAQQ